MGNWFSALADAIRDLVVWLASAIWAPFEAAYVWLHRLVYVAVETLYSSAIGLLPESFATSMNLDGPLAVLFGYAADFAWILPVAQCLSIVGGAFVTIGTIRMARWGLAFVPTIGG